MAENLSEPHCDIEDADCMFYPQCRWIFEVAKSMGMEFRCPVVDVHGCS